MTAPLTDAIPFVEWEEFFPEFRSGWRQGEHVSAIGPTGSGKTTLLIRLVSRRSNVVALACKPQDPVMTQLLHSGYTLERYWQPEIASHIVLWPHMRSLDDAEVQRQREVFTRALNSCFRAGGWCVFIDEVAYLTDELKMDRRLRILWQLARTSGITMVAGTQRPAFVPLTMYSSASHLFFWASNDETDLRRIGGLGGVSRREIIRAVSELDEHEILYVNTRKRTFLRTKVNL